MKLLVTLILAVAISACTEDVGKVSLGLFTTKDVIIKAEQDPKIPGVTCHISHIEANLDFSDPSDMSIACRQTGPILPEHLNGIDLSQNGEVIFRESKSILLKSLKVRRIFDKTSNTLMYLSYSTKETNGSHHHALSTVPLYKTKAWNWAETLKANIKS